MNSLNYVAVSTDHNGLVNRHYPNVLYNPTRQNFDRLMEYDRYENSVNFGDSGGFQVANYEGNPEKWCKVFFGVGIKNRQNSVMIDPNALCREYAKLNIRYGFTLDYPFWEETNSDIFLKKLTYSYTWAKHMFDVRNQLCPRTVFLVPLHFSTKDQLDCYYSQMSQLAPEGYAIPAFQQRSFDDVIKISYILSFLNHKGIKIVHLLGASNRVLIAIMAAATGQKMFEMISFDSRTWNNANKPYKKDKSKLSEDYFYINPQTLNPQMIVLGKTKIVHFLPPRLKGRITFDPDEDFRIAKDKIFLLNAFAIRRYAKRLAEKSDDIPGLLAYLSEGGFDASEIRKATVGIQILLDSITRGFDYVRRNFSWE